MTSISLTGEIAADRIRDLRQAAAAGRLAALARCCRPQAWRAAVSRLRDRRRP